MAKDQNTQFADGTRIFATGLFQKNRNIRFSENWQKQQNENRNNFFIQTPISIILGSLESQQRALQDYAEKHHSPSCEKEAIKKEFDLSQKRQTGKTSNTKNATRYLYEIRFWWTRAWYGDEHKL